MFCYNVVISQYLSDSKHVPLWNFVYERTRLNKWPVPWRHILAINSTFRDYRQLCKVAIEASISSARSRCQIFPWIQLQVYNPPPPPRVWTKRLMSMVSAPLLIYRHFVHQSKGSGHAWSTEVAGCHGITYYVVTLNWVVVIPELWEQTL